MAIQRETVRALGDFFWRSQAREVGAYDQVDERSVIKRSLRNPEMAVRARSIPAKMIGGQASKSLTELGSWMKTDESRRRLGFGWATPFLDGCKPKCTVPDGRLRIREVMMGCCSPILSSLDLSMTDRGWKVVVVTLSLPLPSITRARQRSVKWIAISRCSTLAIAENTLDDEYSRGRTSQTCRQEKDQNNKFEHSQDVGLVLGGAMR